MIVSALLAPVGIALLVFGGDAARRVALACVLVGLVLMVVPISPFLRARLRRREAREHSGEERRGQAHRASCPSREPGSRDQRSVSDAS